MNKISVDVVVIDPFTWWLSEQNRAATRLPFSGGLNAVCLPDVGVIVENLGWEQFFVTTASGTAKKGTESVDPRELEYLANSGEVVSNNRELV